ncbi:hypothetical protein [Halomonas denitrificans]|nr:hypothetical protein [Halomonas denitrificans]
MKPGYVRGRDAEETWIEEGCFVQEWSNDAGDADCSIARARVPAGSCTRWHRLHGIAERYVVLEGTGRVELGGGGHAASPAARSIARPMSRPIAPGDVVRIPPGVPQRVHAGDVELVFLAVCTPRFRPEAYEDIDLAV